jgi:NAD(P)H-hydrate repair Nnr-like enzyme with NAD(P)H-hydrate epimerase domain
VHHDQEDDMIIAANADTVRELERRTMITVGDDALMQRAAAGLAAVLMAELRRRTGRLYGSAVTVLVGPGNNGGGAPPSARRPARPQPAASGRRRRR